MSIDDATPEEWNALRDTSTLTISTDDVDHPPHYNSGSIECIDAIEAALQGVEFEGYLRGNVFKYTWRYRYKGLDKDLRKAQWYLNRLINYRQSQRNR
jgi:hypothetical protein